MLGSPKYTKKMRISAQPEIIERVIDKEKGEFGIFFGSYELWRCLNIQEIVYELKHGIANQNFAEALGNIHRAFNKKYTTTSYLNFKCYFAYF